MTTPTQPELPLVLPPEEVVKEFQAGDPMRYIREKRVETKAGCAGVVQGQRKFRINNDWYNAVHLVNKSALGLCATILELQTPVWESQQLKQPGMLTKLRRRLLGKTDAEVGLRVELEKYLTEFAGQLPFCYSDNPQESLKHHINLLNFCSTNAKMAYVMQLYATCFLWTSMALPYFMPGIPGSFTDDLDNQTSEGLLAVTVMSLLKQPDKVRMLESFQRIGMMPAGFRPELFQREEQVCTAHLQKPQTPSPQ